MNNGIFNNYPSTNSGITAHGQVSIQCTEVKGTGRFAGMEVKVLNASEENKNFFIEHEDDIAYVLAKLFTNGEEGQSEFFNNILAEIKKTTIFHDSIEEGRINISSVYSGVATNLYSRAIELKSKKSQECIRYFEYLLKLGDARAAISALKLSEIYSEGKIAESNIDERIKYLKIGSSHGDNVCKLYLAEIYLYNKDYYNRSEGYNLCAQLIEKNNVQAASLLKKFLCKGVNQRMDFQKLLGINENFVSSLILTCEYLNQAQTPEEKDEAKELFKAANELSHFSIYEVDEPVAREMVNFFIHIKELISAKEGSVSSEFIEEIEENVEITKDLMNSIYKLMFQKSSNLSFREIEALGNELDTSGGSKSGNFITLTVFTKQYFFYYEDILKNSEVGTDDYLKAKHYLGLCYLYGIGVGKNETQGKRCLEEALALGLPETAKALAHCYSDGLGCDKNGWLSYEYQGLYEILKKSDEAPSEEIRNILKSFDDFLFTSIEDAIRNFDYMDTPFDQCRIFEMQMKWVLDEKQDAFKKKVGHQLIEEGVFKYHYVQVKLDRLEEESTKIDSKLLKRLSLNFNQLFNDLSMPEWNILKTKEGAINDAEWEKLSEDLELLMYVIFPDEDKKYLSEVQGFKKENIRNFFYNSMATAIAQSSEYGKQLVRKRVESLITFITEKLPKEVKAEAKTIRAFNEWKQLQYVRNQLRLMPNPDVEELSKEDEEKLEKLLEDKEKLEKEIVTAFQKKALDSRVDEKAFNCIQRLFMFMDDGGTACMDRVSVMLRRAEMYAMLFEHPEYLINILINWCKRNAIKSKLVNSKNAENIEAYLWWEIAFNKHLGLGDGHSKMAYSEYALQSRQIEDGSIAIPKLLSAFTEKDIIGFIATNEFFLEAYATKLATDPMVAKRRENFKKAQKKAVQGTNADKEKFYGLNGMFIQKLDTLNAKLKKAKPRPQAVEETSSYQLDLLQAVMRVLQAIDQNGMSRDEFDAFIKDEKNEAIQNLNTKGSKALVEFIHRRLNAIIHDEGIEKVTPDRFAKGSEFASRMELKENELKAIRYREDIQAEIQELKAKQVALNTIFNNETVNEFNGELFGEQYSITRKRYEGRERSLLNMIEKAENKFLKKAAMKGLLKKGFLVNNP